MAEQTVKWISDRINGETQVRLIQRRDTLVFQHYSNPPDGFAPTQAKPKPDEDDCWTDSVSDEMFTYALKKHFSGMIKELRAVPAVEEN